MLEQRNLRLDLTALALVAVIIFLTVALFTYHPYDPVGPLPPPVNLLVSADPLALPPSNVVRNACGYWGALAANLLFNTFGYGSYYLIGTLALIDFQLLRRKQIDRPVLRAVGWLLSLAGATTIIAVIMPGVSPGPVIGAGGYVGALGKALVEAHFAMAGGLILMSSIMIGGLILCTDDAVVQVARGAVDIAQQRTYIFNRAPIDPEAAAAAKKRSRSDLDSSVPEDAKSPLKVKGKNKIILEPAADDEAETLAPAGKNAKKTPAQTVEESDAPALPVKLPAKQQPAAPVAAAAAAPAPGSDPKVRNPLEKRKELSEREKLNIDEANPLGEEEYQLPSVELLEYGKDIDYDKQATEVRRKAKILEKTFGDFGFNVKVVEIETGPVIAQYEVELEAGLRLSKITNLADDLAIALRVPSVRIVAPIPGKNTVGIEVPNEDRQVVCLREVIEESQANAKVRKMPIPLYLGKDVSGNAMVADLAALPHLLIAGRTGTGKSVCLNTIITSILMTRGPDEVRMLMIDPKMVELSGYGRLPHLMHPVVTDMRKAEAILAWAVDKMEERYALLARAGVRHLSSYNQLGEEELMDRLQPENDEERSSIPLQLPYIVIVADELADLMMTAGKEVETHIIRLAQKSRAVGIHLILATQKPTVDVITGLIKSNLPARIAFQVASRTDSRVILDEMGADKLLGMGDMLFLWPGTSTLLRGQGTYVSDDEINSVVAHCSKGGKQNFVHELVNIQVKEEEGAEPAKPGQLKKRDELYESAVDLVVREQRGSVSLLQRALGIGYGRAARLIDYMAEDGIVGQYNGSQAREILMTLADWEAMQSGGGGEEEAPMPRKKAEAAPKRSNKVLPAPFGEDKPTPPPAKKTRTVKMVHEEKDEEPEVEEEDLEEPDSLELSEDENGDAFAEEQEDEGEFDELDEADESADEELEEIAEEADDAPHFREKSA